MRYRGFIFDLDGTIYLGDNLIPGSDRVVSAIRATGARIVFVTNKPLSTPRQYALKLTSLGIPTDEADVTSAGRLTVQALRQEHPNARVYLIGEQVLARELQDAGFQKATDPRRTEVVIISLDRGLSYGKIHFAYHAIRAGARVWATNPDLVCPDNGDEIIDAGATIASIEALIGRPIDRLIGKPSDIMCRMVARMMGLPPEACVVVGDRLHTDIAMGRRAGMGTALVLTGVTSREQLEASDLQPDHVLESLEELLHV